MSRTESSAHSSSQALHGTIRVTLFIAFLLVALVVFSPHATERAYAWSGDYDDAGASLLQETPDYTLQVSIPDLYTLPFPDGSSEGCEYRITKIEGNTSDGVGLDIDKTTIDRYTGMLTLVEAGSAPSNSPDNPAEKFEVVVTVEITNATNTKKFFFPFTVGFKPSAPYFALAGQDGEYNGQPQAGCVAVSGANGDDPNQCWASTDPSYTDKWVGPYVFTYEGINGTTYGPTADRPTNAGTYRVTVALPNVVPYYSDPNPAAIPEGRRTDTYKGIGSTSLDFTIDPITLTGAALDSSHSSATKRYDGTPDFTGVNVTVAGLLDADKDRVRVTASGKMANGAVNAGSTSTLAIDSVSIDPKEIGSNYVLDPANMTTGNVTIVKAAAFALDVSATLPDSAGYKANVDLAATDKLPTDRNGGPTYEVLSFTRNGLGNASVDPGTGKLALEANGKGSGTTDTVTVALVGMGNYEDSAITVHVEYGPKPIAAFSGATAEQGAFDGKPHAGYTGSPQAAYVADDQGTPATYVGPFDASYAGTAADGAPYGPTTQPPVNAGDYRVTLALPATAPCTGSAALDFTIAKAAAFALDASAQLPAYTTGSQTVVELAGTAGLPADLGSNPAYAVSSFTKDGLADATVDPASGRLALTAADAAADAQDAVVVTLSDMLNYEDGTIAVAVCYGQAAAAVSGVVASSGLVYDGSPQAGYTGSPKAAYDEYGTGTPATYDGPFDVSYAGAADGTPYGPAAQPPTNAGDYRVTFALPATAPCTGSTTLDFTIGQASLVFRAEDATMTAGGAAPALAYTAEGLVGSDRITKEPVLSIEGDTSSAGTFAINIAGGAVDNAASYRISYKPGALTVQAAPAKDEPKDDSKDEPAKDEPKKLPTAKADPVAAAAPLAATGDNLVVAVAVLAATAVLAAAAILLGRRKRSNRTD